MILSQELINLVEKLLQQMFFTDIITTTLIIRYSFIIMVGMALKKFFIIS